MKDKLNNKLKYRLDDSREEESNLKMSNTNKGITHLD